MRIIDGSSDVCSSDLSTLLKVIGGELQPDLGSVELSGPFGRQNAIGWVRQEAPGGSETPIEHVLAADRERAALMAESEAATDPHRIEIGRASCRARVCTDGENSGVAGSLKKKNES